eukprot:9290402-Pyramimonas_sp.AAC.1
MTTHAILHHQANRSITTAKRNNINKQNTGCKSNNSSSSLTFLNMIHTTSNRKQHSNSNISDAGVTIDTTETENNIKA